LRAHTANSPEDRYIGRCKTLSYIRLIPGITTAVCAPRQMRSSLHRCLRDVRCQSEKKIFKSYFLVGTVEQCFWTVNFYTSQKNDPRCTPRWTLLSTNVFTFFLCSFRTRMIFYHQNGYPVFWDVYYWSGKLRM